MKTSRHRLWCGAFLAIAFLTVGCFESEIELAVNPDGSGSLTNTTYFGEQMMAMLKEALPAGEKDGPKEDPIAGMIKKDMLAEKAKEIGEGVTLKSAEKITDKKGRQGFQVVYAVADVRKIKLALEARPAGPSAPAPGAKPKKETATIQFTPASGESPATLTLVMPEPKKPDKTEKPPAEQPGPEQVAMMKEMLKDMRIALVVKVNGKITRTNATYVNESKTGVTLIDMEMGKLINDDEAFAKLQKAGPGQSLEDARKLLGDETLKKYIKFETQPKVEIQFK